MQLHHTHFITILWPEAAEHSDVWLTAMPFGSFLLRGLCFLPHWWLMQEKQAPSSRCAPPTMFNSLPTALIIPRSASPPHKVLSACAGDSDRIRHRIQLLLTAGFMSEWKYTVNEMLPMNGAVMILHKLLHGVSHVFVRLNRTFPPWLHDNRTNVSSTHYYCFVPCPLQTGVSPLLGHS